MKTLMNILDSTKYNTDKYRGHNYVQDFYERVFSPFQDKEINILEIGVFKGGSMKLWCDYFYKAKNVVGIDIFNRSQIDRLRYRGCSLEEVKDELSNYDVKLYNINSYVGDEDKFKKFKEEYSDGFDIIIDDGSHSLEAQLGTFNRFNSLMNEGGVYIIEDCGRETFENGNKRVQELKSKVLACNRVSAFKVLRSNKEICIEIDF